MAYVVQQPHSLTNPSDEYRVVLYEDWSANAYHRASPPKVHFASDNYKEAEKKRDELNNAS